MARRPLVAPYATRFHGPGMEEGPDAVLAVLPGPLEPVRVPFALEAPVAVALAGGLPGLADAVERSGDDVPVALLGECTLAPAVAAGLRRRTPDLAILWLDAHGDLNTPATTPSGFLGGMPLAVTVGWCHPELAAAAGLAPPVAEERVALVGARDLDPGERGALDAGRIVEADDVASALARLPVEAPLYVHLDGDVLDPDEAPGVDFPAPGGWSLDRLRGEIALLAASGRVVGVSLCCGNPRRDPAARGARAYAAALMPLL